MYIFEILLILCFSGRVTAVLTEAMKSLRLARMNRDAIALIRHISDRMGVNVNDLPMWAVWLIIAAMGFVMFATGLFLGWHYHAFNKRHAKLPDQSDADSPLHAKPASTSSV